MSFTTGGQYVSLEGPRLKKFWSRGPRWLEEQKKGLLAHKCPTFLLKVGEEQGIEPLEISLRFRFRLGKIYF